jgi:hypothetical protein
MYSTYHTFYGGAHGFIFIFIIYIYLFILVFMSNFVSFFSEILQHLGVFTIGVSKRT